MPLTSSRVLPENIVPKSKALIFAKMDPPENEAAWNKWYSDTYIPGYLSIPGFLSARRFVRIEMESKLLPAVDKQVKFASAFDLDNSAILRSEAFTHLLNKEKLSSPSSFAAITYNLPSFAIGVYEEIFKTNNAGKVCNYAYILGHDVPRDKHKEFNTWYNTEHIASLLRVPGFIAAHRFKRVAEDILAPLSHSLMPQYLTIYDNNLDHNFHYFLDR